MSIIWRIIGAVSIILIIICKKKEEIPESIIGSIIDLSAAQMICPGKKDNN